MGLNWKASGVLRGDRSGEAVYDTLLVGPGLPATWPLHLDRLRSDAARLGLHCPEPGELAARIARAAPPGPLHRLRIELVASGGDPLTKGVADTAVRLLWRPVPAPQAPPAPYAPRGSLRLCTLPSARGPGPLAGVKQASIAGDLLLRRQAQALGCDDALLATADGQWSEASTAALLVGLEDGSWATPGPSAWPVRSTTLQGLRERFAIGDRELRPGVAVVWAVLLNAVWGARPVAVLDGRVVAAPPEALLAGALALVQPGGRP